MNNKDPFLRGIKKILGGCLILLVFSILVCLFVYPIILPLSSYPYFYFSPVDIRIKWANNDYIKEKYITEIFPQGTKIIQDELNITQTIQDPNSKLDEIFLWEMAGWHDPNLEWKKFNLSNGGTFLVLRENESRIYPINWYQFTTARQLNPDGKFYGNDPYWIAYNKVGCCNELSNLFSYMAEHSGVPARTVQTFNHQWVEVKIDGKWMYYDPWCALEKGYYNDTYRNLSLKSKWYNERDYFRDNCLCHAYFNNFNEFPYGWATHYYTFAYLKHDFENLFTRKELASFKDTSQFLVQNHHEVLRSDNISYP